MWAKLLMLFCGFVIAQSEPSYDFAPCSEDDNACVTKITNFIYKTSVSGVPSLKIESLDPMHQINVDVNLSELIYKVINSTLEGFENCKIVDTNLSLKKHKMTTVLECQYLYMYGMYEIDGKLLTLPIQGKGDYTLKFLDYHILIEYGLKETETNGMKYISIKTFTVNPDLRGQMIANMTNLFNGQQELADNVLKFINNNWKPVATLLQGPVLNANVKRLVNNFNKYLKTIPLDKLFA